MSDEGELRAKQKYARSDLERDEALAKFQLDQDLQLFEGNTERRFTLDQMQRDVLAAHTRQDAAHAVIASVRIAEGLRILKWLLIAVIVLQVFIIFR
ncbi:hypothetical protein [Rhizobium sp.]|uniref:hypothetical protein n=1 Tax=Rhizobium sp. TaxID=391 RepID=UPI003F7E52E0